MKYMLMLYEDEAHYGPHKNGPALADAAAKHRAFADSLGAILLNGAGLKGTTTATTIRSGAGGKTVHDGPFAEAKEQLGGYYLIEVPDLDAAIAVAKGVPVIEGGSVEIRPLLSEE